MTSKNNSSAVNKLITRLKVMYYKQDPMLNSIDNFQNLYSALCDLDEIIGMYDIKQSIVDQIKFLLVSNNHTTKNKKTSKFDSHLLHTIIYGSPGTGKTTIGICLSNIWNALGLLKKENKKHQLKKRNALSLHIAESKESTELKEPTDKNNFDDIFLMALISLMSEKTKESKEQNKENKEQNKENSKQLIKYVKQGESNDDIAFDNEIPKHIESSEVAESMRHRSYTTSSINNIKKNIDTKNVDSFKPLERVKFGENNIRIVSRVDFVGAYQGHSAIKTREVLDETLKEGKVLFIDEAYSLINDEKDSFGHEALNEINRYMTENPALIIIFAGYKDRMEQTLFKAQSGLKRRITWAFEISNYTNRMLSAIFIKQLEGDEWTYEGELNMLDEFFNKNMDHFEAYGGDTSRMVFYSKLKYSELKFDLDFSTESELKERTITYDIFINAYENIYCANKPKPNVNVSYLSMYC